MVTKRSKSSTKDIFDTFPEYLGKLPTVIATDQDGKKTKVKLSAIFERGHFYKTP